MDRIACRDGFTYAQQEYPSIPRTCISNEYVCLGLRVRVLFFFACTYKCIYTLNRKPYSHATFVRAFIATCAVLIYCTCVACMCDAMQDYHVTRPTRNWVRLVLVVLIMGLVLGFTAGKYLFDNNLAKSTTTKREENINLLSDDKVGTLLPGPRPFAGLIICLASIHEIITPVASLYYMEVGSRDTLMHCRVHMHAVNSLNLFG